jgi:hypothetical protein
MRSLYHKLLHLHFRFIHDAYILYYTILYPDQISLPVPHTSMQKSYQRLGVNFGFHVKFLIPTSENGISTPR